MKSTILCAAVLAVIACVAHGQGVAKTPDVRSPGPAKPLKLGDPAPPFAPLKWLKAPPVGKFERGHVYVLEFWFVGCQPCYEVMPHLSEIQKKYRGKLTAIGVNSEPGRNLDFTSAQIEKFMRGQGNRLMQYSVAMDDPTSRPIAQAWTHAEDRQGGDGLAGVGYPRMFIVNQQGRIIWMGNPVKAINDDNRLDKIIAGVVDGSFDLAAARADRNRMTARTTLSTTRKETQSRLLEPFWDAMERQDWKKAVADYQNYLSEMERLYGESRDYERAVFDPALTAMLHVDERKGIAYAESKVNDLSTWSIVPGGDPLRNWLPFSIGETIAREAGLSKSAYRYALRLMEAEVAKDRAILGVSPQVVSLAQGYYRTGNLPKAVEVMKTAIATHERSDAKVSRPKDYAEVMADYRKQLADYERELSGQRKTAT